MDWARVNLPHAITIYASYLAGAANMHQYVSQDTLRASFIAHVTNDPSYRTPTQVAVALLRELPTEDMDALKVLVSPAFTEATDVQVALGKCNVVLSHLTQASASSALRAVDASVQSKVLALASDDPEVTAAAVEAASKASAACEAAKKVQENVHLIADHLRTVLYTGHGTRGEDDIRRAAEVRKQVTIKTNAKFHVSDGPIAVVQGVSIFLGGKHDGLVDGTKIVEIKNRQRRLMGVPLYERVQLHAYMVIYNVRHAVLIENYLGEQKEHEVNFDDDFWSGVKSRVECFVATLLAQPSPPPPST